MNKPSGRSLLRRSAHTEERVLPGPLLACIRQKRFHVIVGVRDTDLLAAGDEIKDILLRHPEYGWRSEKPLIVSVLRPQHLFDHLTVLENIFLPDRSFRKKGAGDIAACTALLQRFHIDIHPLTPVKKLQNDQRKLIELVRAFRQKPDLLFLYDTLSDLGYVDEGRFSAIVELLQEEGCGIVYFTTHWEETLRFGDSYSVLADGRLSDEVLTAKQIQDNPRRIVYLLSGIQDAHAQAESEESVSALNSIYRSSELFVKDYEWKKTMVYLTGSINGIMLSRLSTIYIRDRAHNTYLFPSDKAAQEEYGLAEDFLDALFAGRPGLRMVERESFEKQACFRRENHAETLLCMRFDIGTDDSGLLCIVFDTRCELSERKYLILNTFCNEVVLLLETSRSMTQSLLLRESHHRIKNNLQMIISIIYNQKRHFLNAPDSTDVQTESDSLIARIKTISMVHDLLSRNATRIDRISLRSLVDELLKLFAFSEAAIVRDIQDISIAYNNATTVAMLLNELISNVFKHAFKDIPEPVVRITCAVQGSELILQVADNGVGLPEGFTLTEQNSVGASIITSLVRGIHGTLTMDGSRGTTVIVRIPAEYLSIRNEKDYLLNETAP